MNRPRALRRDDGESIREIARLVGVSRSTISLWWRHRTHREQHAELLRRNPAYNRQLRGWAANEEKARARRAGYQERGRDLARAQDAEYAAGCMLYWAEGAKGRNSAQLVNADPEVVRFFVAFLRRYFAVADERFRLRCNLFADHAARQREIEKFWLDVALLPESGLIRSTVNRYSRYSKKKRKNKLPYGTCTVSVHSTEIVQTIYGSIQELAGFDRPEWLG